MLFVAFAATLGMLAYTEYMRMSSANTALSPFEATRKMNDGEAIIIDVRADTEFKSGHLLNARSFPVGKFDERMHELEKFKDKEVLVYCDNGMRATRALAKLKKNGFTKLFSLAGGLTAWEKASLPTVTR